jgi:Fe-S cluster assembly scaffold protein SufB
MTVQNLKKPSLVYGLGVRSPFSSYELEARDAPILSRLETHDLRSYLPFEEAVLARIAFETRTIDHDEALDVTNGLELTIAAPSKLDVTLVGSRIEDLDVSVLVLDVQADTELLLDAEPESKTVHLIYARVAPGATLHFNDLIITAHDSFRRTRVMLEDRAKVLPNHAFFTHGEAKLDLKSDVTHYGRESFSDMKVRGVLEGSSQVIMQGDVTIKPSAFEANGYQQEDLILASPNAIARPIPNLEIGNNDVKCSHGATVSNLDPEAVFYLKSRGLAERDARSLLLASFVAPVLDLYAEVELDRIREKVRGIIDETR